ncbi:MAG: fibronectin type III domain-containing protein [Burkholderiales bacterium]|nr:fibronectin type III domain-containing protein [Burkholderiales bacterium]
MLQVTGGTPSVTLYGFAMSAGHVNITPLTDLVITKALGSSGDPATAFGAFGVSFGSAISNGLGGAKTYVNTQMAAIAGAAPSVDPMTGTFTVGDANDRLLDALGAAMTAAVKSIADLRTGAAGGAALAGTVPPYLAAPTGVAATANSASQITTNWSAVPGATRYDVYRSTTPGTQGSLLTTIQAPVLSYVDTGLTASTAYYYTVKAGNTVATASAASVQASATTQNPLVVVTIPSAPTGLVASAVSDTQIAVRWTAVSGATSYNIYRSTAQNVQGSKVGTSAAPNIAYADTGLTASTPYYYTVTAVNSAGESGASVVSATTNAASVASGSSCLITASASGVPNPVRYCYPSLPQPFTCDAAGMGFSASYMGTALNTAYPSSGAATYTFTPQANCTNVPAGTQTGTIFKTIDGNGTASTLSGISATASSGLVLTDGTASAARFAFASSSGFSASNKSINTSGMVSDGTYLYAVDQGNSKIRKISIADGSVSTMALVADASGTDATNLAWGQLAGIAINPAHTDLFVTGMRMIRKINIATGVVSFIGATGARYYDNALGLYSYKTTFTNTTSGSTTDSFAYYGDGITTDGTSVYVTDYVSAQVGRVLKIDIASNAVSTLVGLSNFQSLGSFAHAMTNDGSNLYIVGDRVVRKINISTKTETILAGNNVSGSIGIDGVGTTASFTLHMQGIDTDGTYLYISDDTAIRKVNITSGLVTTLAGSETYGYAQGTGAVAKFDNLGGLAVVGKTVYATDNYSAIRKVQQP